MLFKSAWARAVFRLTDFGGFYQSPVLGWRKKAPIAIPISFPKSPKKTVQKPATATPGARPLNPPFF